MQMNLSQQDTECLTTLETELNRCAADAQAIYVRQVCVTDPLLSEQLQQEYLEYEEKITALKRSIREEEHRLMLLWSDRCLKEILAQYSRQYPPSTLADELEKQMSYSVTLQFLRMRPPRDRRAICNFMTAVKRHLILSDYAGVQVDIIGKQQGEPLYVRFAGLISMDIVPEDLLQHIVQLK